MSVGTFRAAGRQRFRRGDVLVRPPVRALRHEPPPSENPGRKDSSPKPQVPRLTAHSSELMAQGSQDLDIILDLIQQINEGPDLPRVFELVADALRRIFSIDRFALALLGDDGSLSLTATRPAAAFKVLGSASTSANKSWQNTPEESG
jgi:hypothetical protein